MLRVLLVQLDQLRLRLVVLFSGDSDDDIGDSDGDTQGIS